MRNTILSLAGFVACTLGATALTAQNEVLYYKFNEGGGTTAINYANASPAPATGSILGGNASNYAPGFSMAGLAGSTSSTLHSYVQTGWTGGFSGSFTFAFFMKQTGTPGTALSYFLSNWGSFRLFTNGVAGTGLWLRNWGTGVTPVDIQLTTNVQALANGQWLHVALTVDTTAGQAIWYLDGVAQTPIAITGTPGVTSTNEFRVGGHTSNIRYYDMDEFRFLTRAATAAEVLAWSRQAAGADSAFGSGCGATMQGSGGEPVLGNAGYGHSGTGAASSSGTLTLGFSSTMLGSIPLPINLGLLFPTLPGCNLYGSADVTLPFAVNAGGTFGIGFPIPNNASLVGATLYNQGVILGGAAGLQTTNAVAVSVGG